MDQGNDGGSPPRKISRNKTNMQNFLDQTKNTRRHIEFTDEGGLTGDYAANFSNYLGCYLRETVPCTVIDWKKADPNLKKGVWNNLKARFRFPTNLKF